MTEQPTPEPEPTRTVRGRLEDLSRRLRGAPQLSPEARAELAELVDELAAALDPTISPELAAHLVETSEHLTKALDEAHDAGFLTAARQRLDEAAAGAASKAPLLTGVVRRLVDALADIGA